MLDPTTAANVQFVTSAAFSSDVSDLGPTIAEFAPMDNYAKCEPIFKSVKRTDGYYNEAQFLLAMCDLAKSALNPSGGVNDGVSPTIADKAIRACKAISDSKSDEHYKNFLTYAIGCSTKVVVRELTNATAVAQQIASKQEELNMQMHRLNASGVSVSSWLPQAKQLYEQYSYMTAKNKKIADDVESFYARLLLALAENLKDPDFPDKEIIDLLIKSAESAEGFKVYEAIGLVRKVKEALAKNRQSAKKAKEKAAKEEQKRKKEQLKKAISSWWKSHPDEKAELVSSIEKLKAQIADSAQKQSAYEAMGQEATKRLNEKGEAGKELSKLDAELAELKDKLEEMRKTKIPLTAAETTEKNARASLAKMRKKLSALQSGDDSTMPSASERNRLSEEIGLLNHQISSLGFFSWGKKRELKEKLEKAETDLKTVIKALEEESAREQERLQGEIAKLDEQIPELKQLAAKERASEEEKKQLEINEVESRIAELQPLADDARMRDNDEQKARHDKWQPVIDEAKKKAEASSKKKEKLEKELAKVQGKLDNPELPSEFLAEFMDGVPAQGTGNTGKKPSGSSNSKDKTSYDVVLESYDEDKKIAAIKTVRIIANLGLKEAKTLVESAPAVILEGVDRETALDAQKQLEKDGCWVSLK